jgi:ribokinase
MTLLVVGNATVDISFELDRLPQPGETVIARSRMIDTGGKGLNQAVVANRAGANVVYIAPIGSDSDANLIRAYVEAEGLAPANLLCRPGPTDQSIIYVDQMGENSIVSTAGLARSLQAEEVSGFIDGLGPGDILLMQGNLTRDTTETCLRRARGRGANTVLNPAPISFDYQGIWGAVDLAVVNEVEAQILSGLPEPEIAARRLVSWGAGAVVATLGRAGAVIFEGHRSLEVPAPSVKTIDATGAGDVFCGVLAAALASGTSLKNAVPRAVAAASLSVTRRGTSNAFPTSAELANIAVHRW